MFRSFAMRINLWLVVAFAGVFANVIARAEGEPLETALVTPSTHEDAVVLDPPTPQLPPPVNVRVYRSPDVASEVLSAALHVAETTFAAASVNVLWKECGPSECQTPPAPSERLVRLVRAPKGGSRDTRCLGDALIDAQQGIGVLATVYIDRALELARHLEISYSTLLGRTIAHEIGHLLLATTAHGASGLMRELWSPDELLASRADDWALRPLEAAAIRQRLTTPRADDPGSTL